MSRSGFSIVAQKQIGAAIAPSLFTEMHTTLMQSFDLRKLDVTVMADESLAEKAGKYLRDFYELDSRFQTQEILDGYVHQVVEESLGLGLISDLLKDASVSEIMVNRFDEVYVERHGRITACAQTFSSEASLKVILDRIVTPVGRRLDDASPMVDARLADGSRINAVLSPIATKGISLTVRKFGVKDQTISSLLRTGFIDSTIAGYLNRIVNARLNLLVAVVPDLAKPPY
jgi:pilus assembly protein CpaF